MNFLPIDSSINQRLQYTQSYVLPHDVHEVDKLSYFEHEKQSNVQAHLNDNRSSKLAESHLEPFSSKKDAPGAKVRQDIDDYIKRRSQKGMNDSSNMVVNRSSQSLIQSNHLVNQNKLAILESKVENIIINESGTIKKIAPPMAQTSDNMELPIIKQTDLERLDSSNVLDPLPEVYQSRRQSTVVPLHRKLQQSSVNINLESRVQNYVRPGQQVQSINGVERITQTLNTKSIGRKYTRNLQKYEVNPIIQHEKQNIIFEPQIKQKLESPIEVINIPELYSNSGYKLAPKQLIKRNLIQKNQPQANLMNCQDIMYLPIEQKKIDPIFINDSLNQSVKSKDSITLKRKLQQSNKIPNVSQQINIDSYQSAELQHHYNSILLQRSLVIEKPQELKDIYIEAQNYSQSLNNSKQIKQKRDLQQKKLQQPVPIELQSFLNEDLKNQSLKSSLKRQLEHEAIQKPIQIQLDSSNQHITNEILKSSLRRNLEHPIVQKPIPIQIESQQNEHFLHQSQKSSLKRMIEAPPREQSINISLEPSNDQFLQQSSKSALKRQLEHAAVQEPIKIQLDPQNQYLGSQALKNSLKRNLEGPKVQKSVPLNIQFQQNEYSLYQSQRSTLKRKIEAPIHDQAINIQLQPSKDHYLQQSLKSSLKRNLEALPSQKLFRTNVQHPIKVQLGQSQENSLQQSLKSSLRRNLDAPVALKPINIELESDGGQFRQKSKSSLLRRALEHPQKQQKLSEHSIKQLKINNSQILQEQGLNDPLNNSIHLSERLQTIETPKNMTLQKRDLKSYQIRPADSQLPVNLIGVSQQAIHSSSNRIISEPEVMKKSIHIDYDPCEENINSKVQMLAKRNLKADAHVPSPQLPEKPQKACDEGWNPTKHIFNLFRIPATAKNSGQISFTKSRISTSSLLH